MKKILIVLLSLVSITAFSQTQGRVTQPAGAKIRPDQLRWTDTIPSGDSVWVLSAEPLTGRPAWYKKYFADPSVVSMAGDVIGTTGASFVKRISGVDVENITPILGQVLQYDGSKWKPTTLYIPVTLSGDVTGGTGATVVRKLQGVAIDSITPNSGNVLVFNGLKWIPSSIGIGNITWTGNDKELYFNDNGNLGSSSHLTFDNTNGTLTVQGAGTTSATSSVVAKDGSGNTRFNVKNNGVVEVGKQADALTQNTAVVKSEGSDTNIGLALVPKGNGAITAQVPDGTAAGGNARGQYAVDLQMGRSAATQVASGQYSTVAGGYNNVASGQYSFIGGGSSNVASGQFSFIGGGGNNVASGQFSFIGGSFYSTASGQYSFATNTENIASAGGSSVFGRQARAYTYGQQSIGTSVGFNTFGYGQGSTIVMGQQATGTSNIYIKAGTTETEGSGSNFAPYGTNRNIRATLQVAIVTSDAGNGSGTTGDVYTSDITFTVKKVSNNISILASPVEENKQYDSSMADLAITVTADNATKEVKIQVTPPSSAGSTTKYRAVATLRCTEVAW